MANEEFYNFEEALDALRLKEEELKRLVSEGEIRAFRDGDTMRLRRADVENLKQELDAGEVVDLGGGGEELVFEDDADFDEAGMATEEISDMDTLLEEDVDDVGEIDLEEAPAAAPRRTAPRAAVAAAPEAEESMGLRVAAIATTAVMILGIPVCLGLSADQASDIAKTIAGMFGAEF